MSAEERAIHPEGRLFETYFTRLLLGYTKSCFERDVLRDTKEAQWQAWKQRAHEIDERFRKQNGKLFLSNTTETAK